MSVEQGVVAACIAVVGVLAVLVALGWRRLAVVRREVADLRAALEARPVPRGDARAQTRAMPERRAETDDAFVITAAGLAEDPVPTVPARIEGRLFADIVARETVVKTAGLVHGLRRAASPEVRNRVRFEMRQELKRTRRQRRADLKEALRDLRRRQHAADDPTNVDAGAPSDAVRTEGGSAA